MVRKAFPQKLQYQLIPHLSKYYKMAQAQSKLLNKQNRKEWISRINKEMGSCVLKAQMWNAKHPEWKIVIGSLGFRQRNGDVFNEWG